MIDDWLADDSHPVLRVSLRYLAFTSDIREVVTNGIGRHLLGLARAGRFSDRPVVVCLDEAHQFLNRWLGDEFTRYPLARST
ncbi:MAG: AAA-like domain protein [Solirubrobacterales bacterium]|nr:AAA-like domain protein [Solirubrobacterales bacterium]